MKTKGLTKTQFKEAFKRGLGYSLIELKKSGCRAKYKDIILWAFLHNTCYDLQGEAGRGDFLYEAIGLYEDKSFFEEEIIRKFMDKNVGMVLFGQLCELLYLFAADGSIQAKHAIYEKYNTMLSSFSQRTSRQEMNKFEQICIWITSLDGFAAFKKVVNHLGEFGLRNKCKLNMHWFYSNAHR